MSERDHILVDYFPVTSVPATAVRQTAPRYRNQFLGDKGI
jgi:hypothetical protein